MKNHKIDLIGVAFGLGGRFYDPFFAVQTLEARELIKALQKKIPSIDWTCKLTEKNNDSGSLSYSKRVEACAEFNALLAERLITSVSQHHFPIVIGGDHTVAIGTWSGVVNALNAFEEFGLIWIDAHMDAHTPQTTESFAICGMPVAILMGYGESSLIHLQNFQPKLNPRHVVLIGVRSFESGEAQLLKKLNVTVYDMTDIKKQGFKAVFEKAVEQVTQGTKGFGISIDMDAFDPQFAPGVSYPEPNGLNPEPVISALKVLKEDPRFKAIEITEYNPRQDKAYQTATLVQHLIESVL